MWDATYDDMRSIIDNARRRRQNSNTQNENLSILATARLSHKNKGRALTRPLSAHTMWDRVLKKASTMYTLTRTAAFLLAACGLAGISSSAAKTEISSPWWKQAVLYEIYPRSFQDSNGDGVGDLNGIRQRLGYLHDLGVDAIWIAPMYPSPQVDFGYDVSDYEAVDPQYGDLKDFDRLKQEAGKRHIRIVLDMVLNHTSDKHKWFIESASSRSNSKADWYVWNDGIPASTPGVTPLQKRFMHTGAHGDVVPPNNWESYFGGSAWEWVPARQQFYYHKFYKQQPDLNWRNPAVEKAIFDTMRFWLDRGVAGFRLDAVPTLFEDTQLRNDGERGGINAQGDPRVDDRFTANLPEVHDVLRRMRAMVASYPGDRVLIGETNLPNVVELDKWYGGAAHDELQLPMDMIVGFHRGPLEASFLRSSIKEVESQIHGSQPLLVFDNHDNPRSWDRVGQEPHRSQDAKQIAALLLTTRATPLMYYGEEIGMSTSTPTRVEDVKDPIGITGWPRQKGRDGERTPMQWDASPQAGFTTNSRPWLPVAKDFKGVSVASEASQPASLLNWYKDLIKLRRTLPALREGQESMLDTGSPNVLAYLRQVAGSKTCIVVAMNMANSPQTVTLDVPTIARHVHTLLMSEPSLTGATGLTQVTLPPYSTWVAEVSP